MFEINYSIKFKRFLFVFFIKELTTLKYRNEIQINELDSKFKALTEEHQQSKEEATKLKQTITTLENDLHQSAKTAGHLRTKLALVEQEVKSKQEVIQQTNDRIAIEQDSKVSFTQEDNPLPRLT